MTTIREVVQHLDELQAQWDAVGDYRGVFVRSYRAITLSMQMAVENEEFEDNAWMERLDVQFAREFFDALEAYEQDGAVPRCWRLAFDLAIARRTSVLQDLLLGMNAHIVRDLAVALDKVGIGNGAQRESRRRDHDRVNEVLNGMIDDIQRDVSRHYSLALWLFDRIGGRRDEILTDKGIRASRSDAWRGAVNLADAPTAEIRQSLLGLLDSKASAAAELLATPSSLWGRVMPRIRGTDRALARFFL
jgi:hypothetical protein